MENCMINPPDDEECQNCGFGPCYCGEEYEVDESEPEEEDELERARR